MDYIDYINYMDDLYDMDDMKKVEKSPFQRDSEILDFLILGKQVW